jgi:RNA polymerase sigma factor (sigma-70 family)
VKASREDVEDACAFAWVQFLRRQPDRDRAWRSWLFETAKRQAWTLAARRSETLAIVNVDELDSGTTVEPADPRDRTEQALEFQAALQELAKLPERLQAVVFIRSQSSTQAQVAEVLGVSTQRIDQLLRAAGLKLRDISERRIEDSRPVASPRAARLRELEDDPPKWLVEAIGTPPARSKSSSGVIVAWRRAALAVDDYRNARGSERAPTNARSALDLAETQERARRAVEHLRSERMRRHGRMRGLER